jgi:cellulose synthase/poly-beta-1,6-N-acetylglucosamine synthase-like glycosyltransferase
MFLSALICLILFALYGVLIDYYRRAWQAIPRHSPPPAGSRASGTKISVLVPARNEEGNIGACLGSLMEQSYPAVQFQVIVIDDHSTDNTAAIVEGFANGSGTGASPGGPISGGPSIVCLRLAEYRSDTGPVKAHKKFAIETGVRAATGDLIVTTDADCLFHPDWLQTIAGFYEASGAMFIAAPVQIEKHSRHVPGPATMGGDESNLSLLTVFQTLDFITLQGITGAAVFKKFHSMCNGANLAYEKNAFYEVDGFKGVDSIPSGDDMLLMHKIYKRYPGQVFFLKHRHAIVSTLPETRWKGFINQRVRWASKADQYDDKRIFWVLLLVYIVNLLFVGLLVASFWNLWYLWLLLVLLVLKTAIEYPFVRSVAIFFRQQHLMVYFPFLQPLHILYTVVIGWLGKFGSYRWKDRKINK